MGLGFGLRLEQNQKLIMTPELRQAIKILQLSSQELSDYLNEQVLDNPLIELKEEITVPEKKESDIDWEDYMREMRETPEPGIPREVKSEFPFENLVTRGTSLQEHLYSQLGLQILSEDDKRVAQYLIGNIDAVGYLSVTVEQTQNDLKVRSSQVLEVLSILQSFDPPGVCSRNLQECLLIQLKQKGLLDYHLRVLVENHLENIGQGKLNKVAQLLNIPIIKVQEMADIIRSLNPKPGASFGTGEEIRYIVPDVFVERIDGEYIVLLNDNHVPLLTINKTYSSILNKSNNVDETTRNFVESKLNQAVWLIRSIEQRRTTIYQVAVALVNQQRDFFDQGIRFLKPLNLKQVAGEVGVHESTVSRATANKFIQTPHGTFEFKFFFNGGFNTGQGDSTSSESIKQMVSEIIKAEDSAKPYSDQKVADLLKGRGIEIARRTVSKYREELGIPNTGQRRRY